MLLSEVACKKVGFWFSKKKKKKLSCEQLTLCLKKYGLEAVEIDVNRSIYEQGPFIAIIHKFTDLIIESKNGNQPAGDFLNQLKAYTIEHPKLILIDPLDKINVLLNRYDTYKLINDTKVSSKDKLLHVPSFAQLSNRNIEDIKSQLRSANVRYPFVCKKNISHGSTSHKMCLIFNEEGLKDVDPPSVAQTFIDHGALLYKIYVIGDKYHMVERPSLRNFAKDCYKDHQTIFFHSHDISSGESLRSELTTLDVNESTPKSSVNNSIINNLIKQLSVEIKMTMYGIDVIVCPQTQKHYVIDVNVFPGYDGVKNYLEILSENIFQRAVNVNKNGTTHKVEGELSNGDSICL